MLPITGESQYRKFALYVRCATRNLSLAIFSFSLCLLAQTAAAGQSFECRVVSQFYLDFDGNVLTSNEESVDSLVGSDFLVDLDSGKITSDVEHLLSNDYMQIEISKRLSDEEPLLHYFVLSTGLESQEPLFFEAFSPIGPSDHEWPFVFSAAGRLHFGGKCAYFE